LELLEQVTSIFHEVFDNPQLVITENTNASHIDGWDSFAHINLIVAFEEEFDIEFTTQEISELTCVGDMLNLLQKKGIQ
jgi:acyl carrier protein